MERSYTSEEIKALKRQVRREALSVRDALSEEAQRRASCLITERILGHQWFYKAGCLLCYVSYGSELDTRELLREALRLGKQVYVPRVGAGRRMDFIRIASMEELRPGFHGILEPPEGGLIFPGREYPGEECPEEEERAEKATGISGPWGGKAPGALMLMPGVAYDVLGNRLGYGGGYYDRYLAAHSRFKTFSIGIGHKCQLVESVPVEETDCRPYQVILV